MISRKRSLEAMKSNRSIHAIDDELLDKVSGGNSLLFHDYEESDEVDDTESPERRESEEIITSFSPSSYIQPPDPHSR